MPRQPTEGQLKRQREALEKMQEDPEKPASADVTPAKAASLSLMVGWGESIAVGPKTYELAAFPLVALKQAYELLNACPAVLVAQALCAKDGEPITIEALTRAYNGLLGLTDSTDPESPELEPEDVAGLVANLPQLLSEEIFAPMFEFVLLALRRRTPTLQRTDIEGEFDTAFFISFVRAVFRVNTSMRGNW